MASKVIANNFSNGGSIFQDDRIAPSYGIVALMVLV